MRKVVSLESFGEILEASTLVSSPIDGSHLNAVYGYLVGRFLESLEFLD